MSSETAEEVRDGIIYEFCSPSDAPQVLDLLVNTFLKMEPLNMSIDKRGLRDPSFDFYGVFGPKVDADVRSRYTIAAKHESNIIGFVLADIVSLDDYEQGGAPVPQITDILNKLYESRTELFPQSFLYLRKIGVKHEYQKRGISRKMMNYVIERARTDKVIAIVTEASSLFSQNLLVSFGFRCIGEVKYEEFKDKEGEVVFKDMEPHESFKTMILYL